MDFTAFLYQRNWLIYGNKIFSFNVLLMCYRTLFQNVQWGLLWVETWWLGQWQHATCVHYSQTHKTTQRPLVACGETAWFHAHQNKNAPDFYLWFIGFFLALWGQANYTRSCYTAFMKWTKGSLYNYIAFWMMSILSPLLTVLSAGSFILTQSLLDSDWKWHNDPFALKDVQLQLWVTIYPLTA